MSALGWLSTICNVFFATFWNHIWKQRKHSVIVGFVNWLVTPKESHCHSSCWNRLLHISPSCLPRLVFRKIWKFVVFDINLAFYSCLLVECGSDSSWADPDGNSICTRAQLSTHHRSGARGMTKQQGHMVLGRQWVALFSWCVLGP